VPFTSEKDEPPAGGSVNQELLLRNEYPAAENRILHTRLPSRLRLSNSECATLAEIGKRLGRKALREVARVARPDTILMWYQKLVAQKFAGYEPGESGKGLRREIPGLGGLAYLHGHDPG